jgi:hypothetical protein
MTDTPVPNDAVPEDVEDVDAPEATEDEPTVVPNRADRRGKSRKGNAVSKIPGQAHGAAVVGRRQFSNRRSGG